MGATDTPGSTKDETTDLHDADPPSAESALMMPDAGHGRATEDEENATSRDNGTLSVPDASQLMLRCTSVFQAVGTLSGLGAGFIATVLFSDIKPSLSDYNDSDLAAAYAAGVRLELMVAWLMFVLSTMSCSIAAVAIHIFDDRIYQFIMRAFREARRLWSPLVFILGIALLLLLTMPPILGFAFVAFALGFYNTKFAAAAGFLILLTGVTLLCLILRVVTATACAARKANGGRILEVRKDED